MTNTIFTIVVVLSIIAGLVMYLLLNKKLQHICLVYMQKWLSKAPAAVIEPTLPVPASHDSEVIAARKEKREAKRLSRLSAKAQEIERIEEALRSRFENFPGTPTEAIKTFDEENLLQHLRASSNPDLRLAAQRRLQSLKGSRDSSWNSPSKQDTRNRSTSLIFGGIRVRDESQIATALGNWINHIARPQHKCEIKITEIQDNGVTSEYIVTLVVETVDASEVENIRRSFTENLGKFGVFFR